MARRPATHVDDAHAVGQRLRALRAAAGLTLAELAFPGCSVSYLSRIERGGRVPSAGIAARLAERLGVPTEHLTGRRGGGTIAPGRILMAEMAMRMRDPGAEAALHALLEEADAAGDAHAASRALEGLGVLAADAGHDARAVALLERARDRDPAAGARLRPGLFEELGRSYAAEGDLARAIAVLRDALQDVSRAPADPSAIVRFGLYLASALTDHGDFAGAEQALAAVLAHERSLADPVSRARVAWTLARTYAEQGRDGLAERYARLALAEYEASEEAYRLGRAHLFLGQILLDQGRRDEAAAHLDTAAGLMAAGGPTPELASLALEQARAALAGGDTAGAAGSARSALDLTEGGEPSLAGGAYAILAQIALDEGRLDDARFLSRRALDLVEPAASPRHRDQILRLMAMIEQRAGDPQAALDALWRTAGPPERPLAHRSGADRRTLLPE